MVKNSKKTKTTINKSESNRLKKILDYSYGVGEANPDLTVDQNLSGKRVTVLTDKTNSKTYVVHRGTHSLKDWFTDFQMALGYEGGRRFRHSNKIQQKAESKYGSENVVTLGHSLGGRLAEKFGQNSSNVITFNKAVTPRSILETIISPISSNQYDLRTTVDPVSSGSVFQRRLNDIIEIPSHSLNLLAEHGLETLR